MKLSTWAAAILAALLLLTGCDPAKKIPGVNAPFTVLYVLGDIYDNEHRIVYGVSLEVRGTLVNAETGVDQPVAASPNCKPAANNAMICTAPTVQVVDLTGVQSFAFTFRFLTNIPGWSVGCLISPNQQGATQIMDQEHSDRTSATHNEVAATCSWP